VVRQTTHHTATNTQQLNAQPHCPDSDSRGFHALVTRLTVHAFDRGGGGLLGQSRRDGHERELLARVLEGGQRDGLTAEEPGEQPVHAHPHLAVEGGHPADVVRAVHEPGGPAAQLHSVHVRDALTDTETGYRADVLVHVVLDCLTTQCRDDVVRESLG